jgi:hypothetical protein
MAILVRATMQPTSRKLTTLQKAILIRVLREFPDQEVRVCYHPSASDSLDYAQDFLTVFKAIGWNVTEGPPFAARSIQSTGLAFVVSEQSKLPPSAEALRDTLRIYAIEVATFCDLTCNTKPGSFILAIGPPAYPEFSTPD